MALPSGYTQIDYIEATGTQYIDTGVKPNQNTRVVMDIEVLATTQCAPFGARESMDSTTFTLFLLNATSGRTDYGTSKQSMTFDSVLGRYMIDANKNTTTVNGVAITHTAATFSVGYNLFLLAVNTAGTASNFAKAKLYSCKIYNIGSIDRIIRNFIPCKSDSGEIGLWDDVGGKFYANAGTGTLKTGNKHKTLIGGTGYEIKSGRVLIGGTGYDIKKGRTLIDGTGYDISFSTPVGELAIGSSVYMNIDGARTEFIIVQQGKPDASVYDDTCNGTWLLAKNIYSMYYVGLSGYMEWRYAPAQEYANGTFLSLFEPWVQSLIKSVNFPNGHTNVDTTATEYKITVPHPCELGYTGYPYKLTTLDFFKNSITQLSATYNGTAEPYFLRETSSTGTSKYYWYICASDGAIAIVSNGAYTEIGFRPLLVIPQDALVNGSLDLIQS